MALVNRDELARIKSRLAHLAPRKQAEIMRASRILRAYFAGRRTRSPKNGKLLRIMLVGVNGHSPVLPDQEAGEINHYDIWAFVDHAAYRGLNRYWGRARRVIASDLRGQANVELSVFTTDEMPRVAAVGNRFLADKFESGIILYEATSETGQDRAADLIRLQSAVDDLPPLARNVLLLAARDSLTYPDIAARLGITVSQVEQNLAKALSLLTTMLRKGE